ncbi:MAG: BrnT family toxin [Steroidobacteraceae bacterium]
MDGYEWDPAKAAANFKRHGVHFADAALALEDVRALTTSDPDACGEQRFICLSADPLGRVLVTVFAHRGGNIRIISSREASPAERLRYEEG